MSVESLDNNIYLIKFKIKKLDMLNTFLKLPPLIKGYLRVGGKVSESFFVDHEFNTIDLCVVVKIDNIEIQNEEKIFTLIGFKVIAKNNIYFRPIIKSSIIDQIEFNIKLFLFLFLAAPMILMSFILGGIFPFV